MDPIADLLTTIRNNMAIGKSEARFSYSKLKTSLLEILAKRSIVKSFKVETENSRKFIVCQLETGRKPYHLRRISKPGQRIYLKSKDIRSPLSGLGFLVVSTPKGLLTGSEARKIGVGGEVICEVW